MYVSFSDSTLSSAPSFGQSTSTATPSIFELSGQSFDLSSYLRETSGGSSFESPQNKDLHRVQSMPFSSPFTPSVFSPPVIKVVNTVEIVFYKDVSTCVMFMKPLLLSILFKEICNTSIFKHHYL